MTAAPRAERPRLAFAGIWLVTMLGMVAVGATLPVLPDYIRGELGEGDFAVGIAIGAFAVTGLLCRPLAGQLADLHGRRPTVLAGISLTALSGALLFVSAGLPGVILSRLVLGSGEGSVFTAGSAWVVDMSPRERRGRQIGLYGLAIWTGLTLGPPIGVFLQRAGGYDTVWAFAAAAPLLGTLIAARLPELHHVRATERGPLVTREAIGPGLGLSLGIVGYAAVASFIVLHLDARGIDHGAEVFTAFAAMVVLTRLRAGHLPDRIGAARCAIGCAVVETGGLLLIATAGSLAQAIAGALAMGAAFSLLYPSLSLLVIERVPVDRRGAALGTFTACFDLGMGTGAPIVGAAAAIAGYPAAFVLGAISALGSGVLVGLLSGAWQRQARAAPAPEGAASAR